jgi:membrane-bound lytic murein transglycosylase D
LRNIKKKRNFGNYFLKFIRFTTYIFILIIQDMKISKLVLTFSVTLNCFVFHNLQAQLQSEILEERIETIEQETLETPKIEYPFQLQVIDSRDGVPYTIKIEDPQLVEKRLKSIENIMPMVYNESVKKYIDFFLIKRPSFTKKMMEEKELFFPVFEKYLAEYNMPNELKYLSLLESGLDPKAVSRSKAVGLWQFMTITGREMGLEINTSVDERMHIEKSTDAACRYLRTLYRMFEDWDLALASYNTGPGRIRRTIKSTGLGNYWDLHPHIHPDTRAYVPQFIALAYLMNFGKEHGINPTIEYAYIPTEKVFFNGGVDLKTLADLSQISISEIKKHNPHIKVDLLPTKENGYEISLPLDKIAYFNANRATIIDSSTKIYRAPSKLDESPALEIVLTSNQNTVEPQPEDGSIIIGRKTLVPDLIVREDAIDNVVKYERVVKTIQKHHKVKRGEFMNKIAMRYDVTMNEIKKWNHKKSSKVLAGETLVIYVKESVRVKSNSIAHRSSFENIKSHIHTVKPGDTLWNISQRYDGVSIEDIKKWNQIRGNTVKVGQRIKIKA